MLKFGLLLLVALTVNAVAAQNVKSEDIDYRYIKLPLSPLPATIVNYQSSIFAAYEMENQRKRDQYEQDLAAAEATFQRETQEYPAKVKAAEDKFTADMAEYNKKSMAEKIVDKQILNENNKPVKQIPSQPYKRSVQKPEMKTSYDYPAMASTYLMLDGYSNSSENAVKIEVTLNGFEYTSPRQLTEIKKIVSSANGVSTTKDVTYYYTEFTYRHTMSVKVTGPDGKEIYYVVPQELSNYKTYKSPSTTTSNSVNAEQIVKSFEEKILQENLTIINNLVNDKIGYKREPRKTSLSYIKTKDDIYSDLMTAYNDATSGLKTLVDDTESAKGKLEKATQFWNTALTESDVNDKKARIDKDVTIMIYFNLLETAFALKDIAASEKIFSALNTLSISNSDKRQKEAYETLFIELKKRVQLNKI